MIYTEATMMLWPRLLHAARAIDPAVADALKGYMLAGGQFQPFRRPLFPSGTMKVTEAEQYKAERIEPRRAVIIQAVNVAKSSADHPWVPAVETRWRGLNREAEVLFEEARVAWNSTQTHGKAFLQHQATLLDTMAAAIMVGESLNHAGFDGYAERLEVIGKDYAELAAKVHDAHIPYDPVGKSIAIDTPDGRLWLVDWYGLRPDGWQEGEMRILESDLGVALQKFDGVERWWLAEALETRPKEKQQTA